MVRRPPRSTRTDTLFPYTPLFRSQAEQILATAEGAIAAQTSALAQDENLIRLLVGGDVDRATLPASLAEVTPAIVALPAGVSSRILLRRPDVIAAEYRLRAAHAPTRVPRAGRFPTTPPTEPPGFPRET